MCDSQLYKVPMYESERGWGGKVDGYAGPFATFTAADDWATAYNNKYNSEDVTPDYYIAAQRPVPYENGPCDYGNAPV